MCNAVLVSTTDGEALRRNVQSFERATRSSTFGRCCKREERFESGWSGSIRTFGLLLMRYATSPRPIRAALQSRSCRDGLQAAASGGIARMTSRSDLARYKGSTNDCSSSRSLRQPPECFHSLRSRLRLRPERECQKKHECEIEKSKEVHGGPPRAVSERSARVTI